MTITINGEPLTETTKAELLEDLGLTDAAAVAVRAGNAVPFETWSALDAAESMIAGDRASVISADTGTHIDPVVGGTVANAGLYEYSASPAGWERIADLDSQVAEGSVSEAEAAAAGIAAIRDLLTDAATGTDLIGFQGDIAAETATGTLSTNDAAFTFNDALAITGKNVIARVVAFAAGWMHFVSYSKSGDNLTGLGWCSRYCAVGLNEFLLTEADLPMPLGGYLSFSGRGVVGTRSGTGVPYFNATGGATGSLTFGSTEPDGWDYSDAGAVSSVNFLVQFEVFAAETALQVAEQEISATAPFGRLVQLGSADVTATPNTSAGTNFRMHPVRFPYGGFIVSCDVQMATERSCPVIFGYGEQGGSFVPYSDKRLSGLAVGVHTNVPVGIFIPPNGRWGAHVAGVAQRTPGQWPGGFIRAGSTLNAVIPAASASYSIGNGEALISCKVIEFTAAGAATFRSMLDAYSVVRPASAEPVREALVLSTVGQSQWRDAGGGAGSPVPDAGTCFVWDDATSAFIDLATATNTVFTQSSIRAAAKTAYELSGKRIYVVPNAVGGSSMQIDWSADGDLRAAYETRWALAQAALNTLEIAWAVGIVQMQGEADANGIDASAGWASKAGYKAASVDFYAFLRSVHGANVRIGIVRTGFEGATSTTGYDQIRAAQDEVAAENVGIDMIARTAVTFRERGMMGPDGLHYNQQGKNENGTLIGRWFAAAMVGA